MATELRSITPLIALLLAAAPVCGQEAPRLDVVFLLDATGSMSDEIDAVKERIREMIAEIAVGDPAPDVRFGIVAYRDRGDEYITRTYALSRDIDRIVANLEEIEASGGGDYPESLIEGLHTVIHELNWDRAEGVSRLVFLIADAPPHLDYGDDYDYIEEYQMAVEAGITVHALGASGLDEEGERIFQEIAGATGGEFQWLTYESRYVAADGEEVIAVVTGRTTTFTKGDSTWTVDGAAPGFSVGRGGPEEVYVTLDTDALEKDGMAVPTAAGAGETPGNTSTNLTELITRAVKDAAADQGVEYAGTTAVPRTSWGRIKEDVR